MAEPGATTQKLRQERGNEARLLQARRAGRQTPVLEEVSPEAEPTRFGRRYGALEHLEEGLKEQAGGQRTPYQFRGERTGGGKRLLSSGRELYSRIRNDARKAETRRTDTGEDREAALRRAALASASGMATLDKRTGEIKEGFGGASSGEAARLNVERRLTRASDQAAAQNVARRTDRASDEAAEQNRERFRDLSPRGTLLAGRRSLKRGARAGQTPQDEGDALSGNAHADKMRKYVGAQWLKSCWAWLFPSFGHSIHLINITFFIGFMSDFARKWIPEVGEEWFVGSGGLGGGDASARKAAIKVVKVGELAGMGLITFLVGMFDLFLIMFLIFIILTIEKIVSVIPGL